MRNGWLRIGGLCLFVALRIPDARSSKPLSERSIEACEALANAADQELLKQYSPSALAPLHVILGSTKCSKVAERWRRGDAFDRRFPSAGLLEIFRTADIAAENIIESLGIEDAVEPVYNKQNPFEGAAATRELLRSKKPPKYIRNAVLIHDRVLTVVPLLERLRVKDAQTGMPVYAPIITKGHQELHDFDILSAAFAAWALEAPLGALPPKAFVYLRPMEKRRSRHADKEGPELFELSPDSYVAKLSLILERFKGIVRDETKMDKVAADARRCTHCARCPWASLCKKQFDQSDDFSMIPLPPTPQQAAKLKALGFKNLLDLASLDVNSARFIEVALLAGIKTERLNYFVGRALSRKLGVPFLYRPFEYPVSLGQKVLHTDFEDLMNGKLISGVYLFGMKFEQDGKEESRKVFIWTKSLEQESVDEAWANFIREIKKEYALDGGDYSVAIFSKHEQSKFEQEFDILKMPINKFSAAERRSPYYFESESESGAKVGRLIRRREFFKKHPDIKPADIAGVMNRLLDLLPFFRRNISSPGYTNSIKALLPLVQGRVATFEEQNEGESIEASELGEAPQQEVIGYLEGQNGLESRDWANRAFATGEQEIFDDIESYNNIDVEATSRVLPFLKAIGQTEPHPQTMPSDQSLARFEQVNAVIKYKAVIDELAALSEIFETALGKKLSSLSADSITQLALAVSRVEYLEKMKIIADTAIEERKDDRSEKQAMRFDHNQDRAIHIRDWLEMHNPDAFENLFSPATEALVEILDIPTSRLTPGKLEMLVAYENLLPLFEAQAIEMPRKFSESFEVPESWMSVVEGAPALAEAAESPGSIQIYNHVARALYYKARFSGDSLKINLEEWVHDVVAEQ